jgi:DNA-binding XRE family transcriptional regulator
MPEPVSREPIGSHIRRLREKKGWTLSELARQSSVSRSYLYQLEENESDPTQETVQKLADAFGVLVSELLGEQPTELPLPESLRQFADEMGLGSKERQMLAGIEYRGKRPSSAEEWRAIYLVIKGMLERDNKGR